MSRTTIFVSVFNAFVNTEGSDSESGSLLWFNHLLLGRSADSGTDKNVPGFL